MRLLQRNDAGDFSLKEFTGDAIPRYAVLSHTWGADNDEVTLADLKNGTGTSKAGYRKLRFCAEQAAKDHIPYFWVDTCCIDQSSSADVTTAINSMFAWYRDAARCYVYLSDVSVAGLTSNEIAQQVWMTAYHQSRWFTRGWTLQELIAPLSVDFFSVDGQHLGSKHLLLSELHSITGIDIGALRGSPLKEFDFDERMSWMDRRQTKLKEDVIYSLLGLFDVHMPLIYGEGREKALTRLKREYNTASGDDRTTSLQVSMPRDQAVHTYHGPVFNGTISGKNVITGTHVAGGTVNFTVG
jgi:hypothetical protein